MYVHIHEVLQIFWDESLETVKDTEMRSWIQGISSRMNSSLQYHWESYYDDLCKTLQLTSSYVSSRSEDSRNNWNLHTQMRMLCSFGNQSGRRQMTLASMKRHFLDRENVPEGMKMEQVKVNSLKVWKNKVFLESLTLHAVRSRASKYVLPFIGHILKL